MHHQMKILFTKNILSNSFILNTSYLRSIRVISLGYSITQKSYFTKMNRPRNRQPRPPRQQQNNQRGGPSRPSRAPATPQQASGTVPTVQQVIPGASVFIILKEDQPTGEETKGIVQDLLTRGNHHTHHPPHKDRVSC